MWRRRRPRPPPPPQNGTTRQLREEGSRGSRRSMAHTMAARDTSICYRLLARPPARPLPADGSKQNLGALFARHGLSCIRVSSSPAATIPSSCSPSRAPLKLIRVVALWARWGGEEAAAYASGAAREAPPVRARAPLVCRDARVKSKPRLPTLTLALRLIGAKFTGTSLARPIQCTSVARSPARSLIGGQSQ